MCCTRHIINVLINRNYINQIFVFKMYTCKPLNVNYINQFKIN